MQTRSAWFQWFCVVAATASCADPPDATPVTDAGIDRLVVTDAADVTIDTDDVVDATPDAPMDAADAPPDAPPDAPLDQIDGDATADDADDALGCAPDERACGGRCVATQWDAANCGGCGARCATGLACSLGRCQATCDAPRSLCPVGGLARCVDALEDPANCGECGRGCGDGQACSGGRCVCPAGRVQCAVRCTDAAEDTGNCGGCGVVCPSVLNGRAQCVRGACGVVCSMGYHRCGSACVDDMSIASCGALCTACPPVTNGVPTCDGRVCGATCSVNFHVCAGVCVTSAALATCGASCTPCAAPSNATPTCDGRACGFACNTGFHACDGACLGNTSIASCGASCSPCAAASGATATCDGRVCGFTCAAGLGNCDADASNGCETDTRASATHCGACGRPCAAVAGARPACVASACGFVCDAGLADCDHNPANGCETDTRYNAANCGVCGRACASGEVCSPAGCRVPHTGWSKRFGADGEDGAQGVAVDAAGNSVVVGRMRGPSRIGEASIAGAGALDAFAVGLRPDSTVRWARSFGGTTNDVAYGVALDDGGNAYVVGTFTGRADFGSGPVASIGDTDAFVASLTPDGALRWARTFGADGADAAFAVTVDGSGVYVTGSVRRDVDFGDGLVVGTASPDAFVLALTSDGTFRWVRRFAAIAPRTGSGAGYGLAAGADGAVVAVGYFQGSPNFGGDTLVSAGNFDMFLVSLSASGAQRWSRRFGGGSVDWAQAVAIDPMNNVFVSGYYQGTVDFGGGALTAPSGTDVFLASFTVTGGHRWSRRFGGATGVFGSGSGYGLAIDVGGNAVLGGTFGGNVDFGGGFRASAGGGDAFLVSYTNAGAYRWSRRFGGDGEDEIRGVGTDGAGNVYGAGAFEGTVDFGVGPTIRAGATDAFAIQYVQ